MKKLFFLTFILGMALLNANVASAQDEIFIKKEMLSPSLILHEIQEANVLPCANIQVETPCEENKPCSEGKPCEINVFEDVQQDIDEQKASCEKCSKKEFFAKMDKAVGLTAEQQARVDEIRSEICAKIKPLKKELMNKKGELNSLKRTKMSQIEIDNRTKILNKEVKNLKKEIKTLKKSLCSQYRALLTKEQLKIYKNFKKEMKKDLPCCLDCQDCDCQNDCSCAKNDCDCKNCICEDCKCSAENHCGCGACNCKDCNCTDCDCKDCKCNDNCSCFSKQESNASCQEGCEIE